MQRCFHIVNQLAKHFKLTVIINQKKNEFLLASNEYPALKNANVYSTHEAPKPKDIFKILPEKWQNAFRYRWYKKNLMVSADGNFLKYYPVLLQLLQHQKYDAIILENIATLNAVNLVRKYDKMVKIIYDAHNVESNLAADLLTNKGATEERYFSLRNAERFLYKKVDAAFACSKKDKSDFEILNNGKLPMAVVANGVNIVTSLADEAVGNDHPYCILFCAFLSTPANTEGLSWFYHSVWPEINRKFPGLKLLVAGSGKLPVSMQHLMHDTSLIFTGAVDDIKEYYNRAAVSIVPLKTGSGTRLKILEAMSYGVPVVSTSKGAEGIEYTNGSDIIIADTEQSFANSIIHLLRDKAKRFYIQQHARDLVQNKYDWNIIGQNLYDFINKVVNGEE